MLPILLIVWTPSPPPQNKIVALISCYYTKMFPEFELKDTNHVSYMDIKFLVQLFSAIVWTKKNV